MPATIPVLSLDQLPPEQREVVELIRCEKTATEAAAILGIAPSDVLRLLTRALATLGLAIPEVDS